MARHGGPQRHAVAWWATLTALAVMLGAIGWTLRGKDGLGTAANWAQLAGVVLAVPPLLVLLQERWRRATASSAQVDQVLDVLAAQVHRQWDDEAVRRTLDDPVPIPVRWRPVRTPRLVDHPDNLTPGTEQLEVSSGDVAALAGAFRGLRRRRLVLLGGAGTGKTTLAVQLVRHLLATRDDHPGEPVPILVPAAEWDPGTDPDLYHWLGERVIRDYPALRSAELAAAARALTEHGHLLAVLDGLDELPEPAQAKVITALNRSLSDTDQLILTSRTTDYGHAVQAAQDVLTSALVISPRLLTPQEAAHYLRRCLPPAPGPHWQQVLQALRTAPSPALVAPAWSAHPPQPPAPPHGPGTVLAALTAAAWGLWLVRAVYIDARTDPAPLLDTPRFPTPAALRTHLLDELIPALITARPPSADPTCPNPFRPRRRHDPDRARQWLEYLARLMTHPPDGSPPTRDFTWWRLARTTDALTPTTRLLSGLTAGLTAGLVFGLVFGLMAGLTVGLIFGLTLGLVTGSTVATMLGTWQDSEAGYANLRLRGRGSALVPYLRKGLMSALMSALMVGLMFGPMVGPMVGPMADLMAGREVRPGAGLGSWLGAGIEVGLGAGLGVGLITMLMSGLPEWAEAPTTSAQAATPNASWRADRMLNIMRTILCVFGVGFGFGVGLMGMLVFGLGYGLVSGLIFGLTSGEHHAWPGYVVATRKLAFSGALPRALMSFLDDAHRLGLLRAVGPIYQFRHADLHDHLAGHSSPTG